MTHSRFLRPDMLTDDVLAQLRDYQQQAEQRGQTLAEMALAWVLRRPEVTSVIVGASSVQQLERNLAAADTEPEPDPQPGS